MNQGEYLICVDDDAVVFRIIERSVGLRVLPFSSAQGLLAQIDRLNPQAFFVDIHLGEGDCGIDLIATLRKRWPTAPVIVMTADEESQWIALALAAGAQDFVRKPLQPAEVKARLAARLAEKRLILAQNEMRFGATTLSLEQRLVSKDQKKASISHLEVRLLSLLIDHREQACTREQILRAVWDRITVSASAIEQRIVALRRALEAIESEWEIITITGTGYALRKKNSEVL